MFYEPCNSEHQPMKDNYKVKENPHMQDVNLASNS